MPKTNKKNGTPKAPRSEAAYIRALSTYDRTEVRRILGSGWHNKGAIARGFVSVAKRDCRFFLKLAIYLVKRRARMLSIKGIKGGRKTLCPSFCFALAYARPFSSHVRNCIADV